KKYSLAKYLACTGSKSHVSRLGCCRTRHTMGSCICRCRRGIAGHPERRTDTENGFLCIIDEDRSSPFPMPIPESIFIGRLSLERFICNIKESTPPGVSE